MTQRPFSTLAIVLGILAALFVFLPWFAVHVAVDNEEGVSAPASTENGLWDRYMGRYTLPLAAIGTLAMAWFAIKRTPPGLSKALLTTAVVCFAAAAALTFRDVICDLETDTIDLRSAKLVADKAVGLYMTFAALVGAFLITLLTMFSPRTEYRD